MTTILNIDEFELTSATLNDSSVEDVFTTIETLILQLNDRISKLVNNINNLNTSAVGQSGSVSSDIKSIQERLTTIEINVNNNTTSIVQLQSDLTALEARVSVNELAITALQTADGVLAKTIDERFSSVDPIFTINDNTLTTFLLDCTAGDMTIILPDLAVAHNPTTKTGWIFNFVKVDSTSNKVILQGIINGTTDNDLRAQDEVINIQAFATSWRMAF